MSWPGNNVDLELSHRILGYLQAVAHGEVYFLETLKELGSPEVSEDGVGKARAVLSSVIELYLGLGKGIYTFSPRWQTPQTFEAQRGVRLLEVFLQRSRNLASRCRSMPLSMKDGTEDQSRFIFAVVRRGLVAENFFVQARYDLASLTGPEDALTQAHSVALASMQQLARFDQEYYGAISQKQLTPEQLQVLDRLWGRQRLLLNMQIVDLVELVATYRGGEAYIEKELASAASREWQQRNFITTESARWMAFEFDIEDAVRWRSVGVMLPVEAFGWVDAGFSPAEAKPWLPLKQPPEACIAWRDARYDPGLALSFVRRGYQRPSDVDAKGE